MDDLFAQLCDDESAESLDQQVCASGAPCGSKSLAGPFAAVALENSLDRILDYAIPPVLQSQLLIGQRVRVPLGRGNRPQFGFVVAINPTTAYPRIKPLLAIDDPRVLINDKLMQLARWMSRYYIAPLGVVIDSLIPSAVKKKTGIAYAQMVRLLMDRTEAQALLETVKSAKRRAILARLLLLTPDQSIEIHRLAAQAGTTPATVRKLRAAGVIRITSEIELASLGDSVPSSQPLLGDLPLNAQQQAVFEDLTSRVDRAGFSVNLLHGVTGSGKTEIYLQCIRRIVQQGRQAIVLVPEIALTPQTVRRFTDRFKHVSILHSGLSATERHRHWQHISSGQAQVIVGARSAVFAPTPNLGMIVVDEEHESSYKQDQIPRYQARDVAIKRAQIEQIPILLGSATPSLETWWKVTSSQASSAPPVPSTIPAPAVPAAPPAAQPVTGGGSYHLLSMTQRVRNLQMPHVELVDMATEWRTTRGVRLIGQRLEYLLNNTLAQGQQAILLLNRRGYSNFVYCSSCQTPVSCKYCDKTMTYHRSGDQGGLGASHAKALHTGQLHCHYCLAVQPLPSACPQCAHKLSLFGLGTQRVEEELVRFFPQMRYARVDSDTMRSSRDYEQLLSQFARGEIQVLLGTQMIAKGLDYPNVTLVGVISGDTALALPDFRASERTFQLITQVAGRAGRGDLPGRVVLQTFLPQDPAIQAAIKGDYAGWATTELADRRQIGLPPFARMVRIILRDQDEQKLHKLADDVAQQLQQALTMELQRDPALQIRLRGPMPCAINRIAGYHRQQIVMISPRANSLQQLMARIRDQGVLSRTDRIAVDVDPVSLL